MVDNMATKEASTATKVPMGKVKMAKISMGIKARAKIILIALVGKTVKTAMGKVKMGNMDKEGKVKAARINMVKVKTKAAKMGNMDKEARGMVRIKAVQPKINMVKVKTKVAKVNMANLAKDMVKIKMARAKTKVGMVKIKMARAKTKVGMVKIKMAKAKTKVAMVKIKMVKQGMVKTRMAKASITPKVKANMDKEPRVMDKIKTKDNMANLDKRMAKMVNMALEIKVMDKINMANKAKEGTDKISQGQYGSQSGSGSGNTGQFHLTRMFGSNGNAANYEMYSFNNGQCYYTNGTLHDNGQTRPLTSQELQQLNQFEQQLEQYSQQVDNSVLNFMGNVFNSNNQGSSTAQWPQMPKIPCFCSVC
uniref:CB1 cannabinoid receptor-interacting protein 1 n=1 Tax=Acrobeloides nanus TaxID=290746 RepID=A0A914EB27_9BILA